MLADIAHRGAAQIAWAMQLTFLAQSLQIDIDHWRHVFLVWGMIWGMEVARRRWLAHYGHAVRPAWAGGSGVALAGAGAR